MDLTFLGATETVTGSRYLLETAASKILIDCGLFQGLKALRLRNWEKFPINPAELQAVILTHAHIDHSGYLPLLVKQGYKGQVFCSAGTADLCRILLPDSGHLQEELADFSNRHGISKHKPALPLYTRKDAINSLSTLTALEFGKKNQLTKDMTVRLDYAGHILGAAMVMLQHDDTSILFSGDLGRFNNPIMKKPSNLPNVDYLVLESTYGNKLHSTEDPGVELATIVNRVVKRGGTVVIPAFAVGRAQEILYHLYLLRQKKLIPDVEIYLDSPMAINATEIFCCQTKCHKLGAELVKKVCSLAHYVSTVDESKALDSNGKSKIIISASGMATGGRVLHHIKAFGGDERNAILFTGYQAEGTRGDLMVNHNKKEIKLLGEVVTIRAEVLNMHNLSAHADYAEIISWLENCEKPPRKVFITHGERAAAYSLRDKIADMYNWECIVPTFLQREKLT